MIPIKQTINTRNGNCFEASIASILEIDIEDIPLLYACDPNSGWMDKLNKWLTDKYSMVYLEVDINNENIEEFFKFRHCFHTIIGKTSRFKGTIYHSVVGYKGRIIFDPSVTNSGLIKSINYGFFVNNLND